VVRQLAAVLVILALSGCAGVRFSESRVHESFDKTVPSAGVTMLHLKNVAGTIRIEAWNKPQIQIHARKSAPSIDALNALHVEVQEANGVVNVITRYDPGFGVSRGGVEYALMVPGSLNLQVENTAGTMTLAGLTANVSASTRAGTIEATMARVGGNQNIELKTTTGTIELRIPKDSNATVTAQSTVGSMDSDFPGVTSHMQHLIGAGGGGKIGNGSATITLKTTTGSIDLNHSAD
jgi:Putative adhesin